MKAFRITLALVALAGASVFAGTNAVIDQDGCVKGRPCKCVDCGQICGSEACKTGASCKGDACAKS